MKKTLIAAALVLTTGALSAFTLLPAKRDTTFHKATSSTKKDIGQADVKGFDAGSTKKDIGQAD